MLAAVWDTPYNIVYLVHIVSVIIGTGLAFTVPILAVQARRDGGKPMQELVDATASKLMFPAFMVAGIAGGAMVGMSSDFYDFGQTWLAIGGALWIIVLVLIAAIYPPSYLQVFNVPEDRKRMLGGILHLSLAVMLVTMTWKWGAP